MNNKDLLQQHLDLYLKTDINNTLIDYKRDILSRDYPSTYQYELELIFDFDLGKFVWVKDNYYMTSTAGSKLEFVCALTMVNRKDLGRYAPSKNFDYYVESYQHIVEKIESYIEETNNFQLNKYLRQQKLNELI